MLLIIRPVTAIASASVFPGNVRFSFAVAQQLSVCARTYYCHDFLGGPRSLAFVPRRCGCCVGFSLARQTTPSHARERERGLKISFSSVDLLASPALLPEWGLSPVLAGSVRDRRFARVPGGRNNNMTTFSPPHFFELGAIGLH